MICDLQQFLLKKKKKLSCRSNKLSLILNIPLCGIHATVSIFNGCSLANITRAMVNN